MKPRKASAELITIVLCGIAFCQEGPVKGADLNKPFIDAEALRPIRTECSWKR